MADGAERARLDTKEIEQLLQSMLQDGCLSDLVEIEQGQLDCPQSIAPWGHLPVKLYKSQTATRILNDLLEQIVPGTPVSYNQILSAITEQVHTESFCYLIGGQVRDILRGKLSMDVDFNYACTAKDVALVCVEREWTVKYKAIGPVSKPNYVLIGDEQTDRYMEGFSIDFNATSECFKADFRQNMLFYDLANNVIIDKSGFGVRDIRKNELRLACAPSKNFQDWADADMALGSKALRYVKFIIRSKLRQEPLKVDKEESDFVVGLLKRALLENGEALKGFWFGYVLGECLSTQEGVEALYSWVCEQGGPSWWEQWLPFVRPKVGNNTWLDSLIPTITSDVAADVIKHIFERSDCICNGLIGREDLKSVIRGLGTDFSDREFAILFQGLDSATPGKLNYDEFIDQMIGIPTM